MTYLTRRVVPAPANAALCAMFAARKTVFADLLKWNISVVDDQYEIDEFDTHDAHYLILLDAHGRHRASARLLPTSKPHLLGKYFSHLVDGRLPVDRSTWEISRFCLDPAQTAADRRLARNQLVTALVDHALCHGITRYCAIAPKGWYDQIVTFGWRCELLGSLRADCAKSLAALHIHIDDRTLDGLVQAGIFSRSGLHLVESNRRPS